MQLAYQCGVCQRKWKGLDAVVTANTPATGLVCALKQKEKPLSIKPQNNRWHFSTWCDSRKPGGSPTIATDFKSASEVVVEPLRLVQKLARFAVVGGKLRLNSRPDKGE